MDWFWSLFLGFVSGWVICKLLILICVGLDRRRTNKFFRGAQIFGAIAMSFMHGAQDGQKFIGVLFLGMAFSNGQSSVSGVVIPIWLMVLCSTVMGVGTSVGGEKIIKSVGMDMVHLEKYQGICRGSFRSVLPAAVQHLWNPGIHDTHENQRYYGRRSRAQAFRH